MEIKVSASFKIHFSNFIGLGEAIWTWFNFIGR